MILENAESGAERMADHPLHADRRLRYSRLR
jgi:hypothetical protein